MAVVYRGPHVVVTDDFVEVLGAGKPRYAIKHLDFVNVFRETRGADARAAGWVAVSTLVAAVAAVAVDYRLAFALGGITLVIAVAYAYLKHGRPGRLHLVAVYRGEPHTLFSSTDQREFAQVCRGLRRALERHHDKTVAEGLRR